MGFQKRQVSLEEMFGKFAEMLSLSKEMLSTLLEKVANNGDLREMKDLFFLKDQRINLLEQEIRREIAEYLGGDESNIDIPSTLMLISIVHDAERIGDYVKNMFNVFEVTPEFRRDEQFKTLMDTGNEALKKLELLPRLFSADDKQSALQFIKDTYYYEKLCDNITFDILKETNPPPSYSSYLLLFRFLKRIFRHMDRVASSVVAPLDKLGYYPGNLPLR
ncbi:MAG: hypothetical protein Kow0090_20510 [Myxococcota bacterium]